MELIKFTDSCGAKRKGFKKQCPICRIEFIGRKERIFCSKNCSVKNKNNKVEIECHNCKTKIIRKLSALTLSKSGLYFCSLECKNEQQKRGNSLRLANYKNISKEDLEKLISEKLNLKELAKRLHCAKSTIINYLKLYNLKTYNSQRLEAEIVYCELCNREYCDTKSKICKICTQRIRRYLRKKAAVELLGGKCIKCGYNENIAALEFHHRNPLEKEITIGCVTNKSWDIIKEELKKCDLLCSNCHRIEHSKKRDEIFLEYIKNYKTIDLI